MTSISIFNSISQFFIQIIPFMNQQNTIIRLTVIVVIAILTISLNLIYADMESFYIVNPDSKMNLGGGGYPVSLITFLFVLFCTYVLFLFVSLFNQSAHFLDAAVLMIFNVVSLIAFSMMGLFWKLLLSDLYQAIIGGPPIGRYSSSYTKYVWHIGDVSPQGKILYYAFFLIFLLSLGWSIYYFIQRFKAYQKKQN
jgi:hypothetical protein